MAAWLSLAVCFMSWQTYVRAQRHQLSSLVLSAYWIGAGRVKTEIVHFLANAFTLHKFRDQRQVLGSELVLTDFDEGEMSMQSVLDFMAQAKADNKTPATVSLRAREGTTLNLLRLYGEAPTPSACAYRHHRMHLATVCQGLHRDWFGRLLALVGHGTSGAKLRNIGPTLGA